MGRLSKEEIINIILARGFETVDISGYQNKSSKILCKCKNGHYFSAALNDIEKPKFQCPKCIGEQFDRAAATGKVPEKAGYRIVAFDQSSNNIGVSMYDNGKLVYYDWLQLTGELPERLNKWYHLVHDTAIGEWQADFIGFEDIQYQQQAGVVTFKILSMVLGIGIAAAEDLKVPNKATLNKVWQSEFAISGSNRVSQKRNVIERVREYFNIEVTDDVGDAILMGRYLANQLHEKWEKKIF